MFEFLKPKRHNVMAAIRAVQKVSPHMQRITLGGPQIEAFLAVAQVNTPGAWVKVSLPTGERRAYTIARYDTAAGTLDLEIVIHQSSGITGPGSTWAQQVKVGDHVGIAGPRDGRYRLASDATWILLAGDMTALPAMQAIARVLPSTLVGEMYVEVATPADRQTVESGASLHAIWLPAQGKPCATLNEVLMKKTLPTGPGYIWIAGESAATHALRVHYLQSVGVEPKRLSALGYWKVGEAAHRDRSGR